MTFIVPSTSFSNSINDHTKSHNFLESADSPIISFSEKIESIDLLKLLSQISQYYNPHFYWENQKQQEAILAYGITDYLTVNREENRFHKAQYFLDKCFKKIIHKGHFKSSTSTPHLFFSFTFFESDNKLLPTAISFLPTFEIVRKETQHFLIINVSLERENSISSLRDDFFYHLEQSLINKSLYLANSQKFIEESYINNSRDFISGVKSALDSINKNKFSKIVLAHALDINTKNDIEIVSSLANLKSDHADCHIFSFSNNQGETFLGASPERLISIRNMQLTADALAGSAPRGKTQQEDKNLANQLLKSEKECREHKAVSDFIKIQLKQLGLKPKCSKLGILQLTNIQHLWTTIQAELTSKNNALEILAKLHPTPAVAGVPSDIACQEIKKYENFDRGKYAAPLGWIDYQGNSEFIVGIRSALINKNHARLYAGAGIVAGSDPVKELAEIELKFQVLLRALGKVNKFDETI